MNTHLTGINNIDTIINNRITNDYTNIKNILPFYYKSAFYWFDSKRFGISENDLLEKNVEIEIMDYQFKNNLIYLTIKNQIIMDLIIMTIMQ